MHTLLGISSLLLVLLGCILALSFLHRLGNWSQRRVVQLLVLALPLMSLGLGLAGLHHFTGRSCLRSAPTWDALFAAVLPVVLGLLALSALCWGVVRLVLMARVWTRWGVLADPALQALADSLAQRLGTPGPCVRLCASDRPLALTYGVVRPTVLLSTWMVEHLDPRELEGVLAHELQHVARRDYLVIWLATILRDAFFYLPTSQAAYRKLQHEKELACDDLAVSVTLRPLALASALAKIWQHAVDGSRFAAYGTAQSLVGVDIEKLEALILENHLHTCVPAGITGGRADAVIEELVQLYNVAGNR